MQADLCPAEEADQEAGEHCRAGAKGGADDAMEGPDDDVEESAEARSVTPAHDLGAPTMAECGKHLLTHMAYRALRLWCPVMRDRTSLVTPGAKCKEGEAVPEPASRPTNCGTVKQLKTHRFESMHISSSRAVLWFRMCM